MTTSCAPGPRVGGEAQGVSRVLVVDDHQTFGDLLQVALSGQPDLVCVGVATDLDAALALVERTHPDLVVMDVQFADDGRDGVSATAQITTQHPHTRVVLLTGAPSRDLLQRAAAAGACSVIAKDGSLEELLTAVRGARTGGMTVQPDMFRRLVVERPHQRAVHPRLTGREAEVLAMLELGIDTRGIARELGITVNTCRGYVKTLLAKLNAHSQLEAVAISRTGRLRDGRSRSVD
jgi:DNA-binding NarL/FixJ family response regulator